jgi:nucleotide-binding universal stress UspA family protein
MSTLPRRVVTGVSAVEDWPLVRWAAAEASARRVELRLVTARPAGTEASARLLLADLAAGARASWPGLAVTTAQVTGPPAAVLRAAAEGACLLAVGADDAGPFMEAISGSLTGELMTTTPCPLGVLPRREWTTPASAPVVVGLDEPAVSYAALAYAFAAASRAERALTVMLCAPSGADDPAAWTAATGALMGFGELFPDVPTRIEDAADDPETRLAKASRHAALLVLGSRGRLAPDLFGSLSRKLIRRSRCPVVIARGEQRTTPRPVPAAS